MITPPFKRSRAIKIAAAMALSLHLSAARTWATTPISGRPVPELSGFNNLMVAYMGSNGIVAGVLGVMKDGMIVYQRGFGYAYDGATALPENTLFRLASCSKPITDASVRQRIAAGQFSLNSFAFNLGQAGGGLLNATSGGAYQPFPGPAAGDTNLQKITVQHLIAHQGGWDRNAVSDLTYRELQIAGEMGIASPPGRPNTVRWILGQSLQFPPGTIPPAPADRYSNIGCLVMGLIVEQFSGQSMISYVRNNVLTKDMWVPITEIQQGRTFRAWQDPREPLYDSAQIVSSVFTDFSGPPDQVSKPYGGWDHEARIGQGGYVTSAATMLEFLQRYHVGFFNANIGQPINATFPLTAEEFHSGAQDGVNTLIVQRTDGVNVFLAFDKASAGPDYGSDFYNTRLKAVLDGGGLVWPNRTSDGFWIVPNSGGTGGVGGFDDPFQGVGTALSYVADGSKLRLKAGASPWTGTIAKRLLIDAPLGPATIGQ